MLYLLDKAAMEGELSIGNEAIAFQRSTPLGKGLTAIFQEAKDKYAELKQSEPDIKKRTHTFVDTFKSKYGPKMRTLVLKETGLDLQEFRILDKLSNFGMYAVEFSMDHESSHVNNYNKMLGRKGDAPEDVLDELVRESMQMADNLDLMTGKLSSSIYGNNRKITGEIYIDMVSAFMAGDLLGTPEDKQLNAENLAAIIMHEIGHVLTLVENAGYWHAVDLSMDQQLKIMKASGNIQNAVQKTHASMKEAVLWMTERKIISNAAADKIKDMISNMDKIENHLRENNLWTFIGSLLFQVFYQYYWFTMSFRKSIASFRWGWNCVMLIDQEIRYFLSNKGTHRPTDTTWTHLNTSRAERMADEYVSRHGMSAALGDGLVKIHAAYAAFYAQGGGIGNKYVRNLFHILLELRMLHGSMRNAGMGHVLYEGRLERLQRMRQNTQAVFKEIDFPDDVKARYVKDLQQIDKTIQEQTRSLVTLAEKFWDICNFLSLPTLGSMIVSGRIVKEYTKVFNQLDEMANNKLYYQAHRLSKL